MATEIEAARMLVYKKVHLTRIMGVIMINQVPWLSCMLQRLQWNKR